MKWKESWARTFAPFLGAGDEHLAFGRSMQRTHSTWSGLFGIPGTRLVISEFGKDTEALWHFKEPGLEEQMKGAGILVPWMRLLNCFRLRCI